MLRTLLKIAPPYDDGMVEEITKVFHEKIPAMEGKDFDVEEDSSLIGGFVAYVGDTIFDASVKKQLDDIRQLIKQD